MMPAAVPQGYKQTEVGVIPEEWEVSSLQDACREPITYGIVQCGPHIRDGVPYVRVSDMDKPELDVDGMLRTTPAIAARFSRSTVQSGDLVYALRGKLGEVRQVGRSVAGANLTQGTARLSPKEGVISDYLKWAMHSSRVVKQAEIEAKGTTFREITLADLRRICLPIPHLPEQRAIAAALSDVDALLGGLERLIAKKRDLKQAAMQQLLTGQTRLPGFSGEWEERPIGELAEVGRGRVISHIEISKSTEPRYPVFSSQTSNNGIMGYLDTYDFEGDYATWTTDGANAGTVFARSGRFNCTNVCGTIKLHSGDHRFIAAALGRVAKSHVSRHLGNPKLMNDVMKRIKIRIPPSTPEQTAIAAVLSDMDAELSALVARRDKTRALKQAMMRC